MKPAIAPVETRRSPAQTAAPWLVAAATAMVMVVAGCGPKPPPAAPAAPKPGVTNAVVATNAMVGTNMFVAVFEDDPKSGGVDPFFPKSTRFTAVNPVATNGTETAVAPPKPPAASLLTLNGIFGAEMASISRTRIMLNEERTIKIGKDSVVVKLLEVRDTSVVVLVDGERKELSFPETK